MDSGIACEAGWQVVPHSSENDSNTSGQSAAANKEKEEMMKEQNKWRSAIESLKMLEDKEWPADLVRNAASGLPTTPPSHTLESEVSPTQFAILIDALREQTAAITKLVRSTEALIEAMSQVDHEADEPQTGYLNGKRP